MGFTIRMGISEILALWTELQTHEISPLSKRYGVKVWQSYLENKNSGARRMYRVYGPGQQEITTIGAAPGRFKKWRV